MDYPSCFICPCRDSGFKILETSRFGCSEKEMEKWVKDLGN
jgi:hypothetical protein